MEAEQVEVESMEIAGVDVMDGVGTYGVIGGIQTYGAAHAAHGRNQVRVRNLVPVASSHRDLTAGP